MNNENIIIKLYFRVISFKFLFYFFNKPKNFHATQLISVNYRTHYKFNVNYKNHQTILNHN